LADVGIDAVKIAGGRGREREREEGERGRKESEKDWPRPPKNTDRCSVPQKHLPRFTII